MGSSSRTTKGRHHKYGLPFVGCTSERFVDTVDSYVRTAQALHMFLDEGGRLPPRFGSKQLEAHEFIGLQALKFIQAHNNHLPRRIDGC